MGYRKSTSIINTKAFLDERVGPGAWDKLLAALSDADSRELRVMVPENWFDYALHARLNRAVCDVFYNGDLSAAEELGRYSADRDLSLLHRWHLRVTPPRIALRHMNAYWRQDESTGSWDVEHQNDQFFARLTAWDGCHEVLCRRLLSYIGRVLELYGEVTHPQHPQCAARGDLACIFQYRWQGLQRAPRLHSSTFEQEFSDIVNELGLFCDLDELAIAITDMLIHRFSFNYVELWIQRIDIDESTLFRCVGTRGGGPWRNILLPHGGRFVGRIGGEASAVKQGELLDALVPNLAAALEAARLRGRQLTREQAIDHRLKVAQTKYGVTDREASVLALIAEGYTNENISQKLVISRRSVETYVSRLQAKLATTGRRDLCSFFWTKL